MLEILVFSAFCSGNLKIRVVSHQILSSMFQIDKAMKNKRFDYFELLLSVIREDTHLQYMCIETPDLHKHVFITS